MSIGAHGRGERAPPVARTLRITAHARPGPSPTSYHRRVPGTRFDDLDRALLHALQVDGRASFRRIAEVLEVSDQTVARRYARLRAARALQVLGIGDPSIPRATQWLLRVRAASDTAARSPRRSRGAQTPVG